MAKKIKERSWELESDLNRQILDIQDFSNKGNAASAEIAAKSAGNKSYKDVAAVVADAPTQSGSYVQGDVQAIADLVNELKTILNKMNA